MKQILLICSLLLCIANIGYSQSGNAIILPPRHKDVQQPTPSCPIGIKINHPVVLVWFNTTYGNVTVKVINSVGATISKSINAVIDSSLTIDVSALGQTYYKVYITNRLGMAITEF